MVMSAFLGIDIGTSGTKALAIREDGTILASAMNTYPCYVPKPLWSEQDPEDWWQATIRSVRQVVKKARLKAGDVKAIGLSGQMHGSVFLDKSDRVIRRAILWNDQRTAAECREMEERVGGREKLIQMVANPAMTGFTAPKILWLRNHEPKHFQKTRKVLLPKDEIRRRMTGEYATEVSDASGMLLLDVARRKGLPVVEDVAQSGGGSFRGRRLGSLGTIGCFSFDYYKVHASGEGGFVATDDDWLHTRAQSWHDTAACWRPNRFAGEQQPGELFCGENYRMSELQGAVALAQIRKTDTMLAGYRRACRQIKNRIEPVAGMTFRRVADESGDTCLALVFFLQDAEATKKAMLAMQQQGVPAGGIYDHKVRDWHIFTYWDHILERKHVSRDGLPWSALPPEELPRYTKDMCPRTLDLLGRAIMIDINWHYTADDCARIAEGINRGLRAEEIRGA